MENEIVRRLLARQPGSHKYDYGHVLVIGGSPGMVGAPFLSASAALRAGAGLVTIASTADVVDKLEARVTEIMTLRLPNDHPSDVLEPFLEERSVSVVVIGPGCKPEFARKMLAVLGDCHLPVVVDGGALAALAADTDLFSRNFILTPHAGEYQRFDESSANPSDFTQTHGVILVLKGQPTKIFNPAGAVYESTTGGPALATAGTGDVLTGIIAGVIAQKIEPYQAACTAVHLGGLAGDIAAEAKTVPAVIASDIIAFLPEALKASR